MSIIDSDLLSIQQARILLEEASVAREDLKELPSDISKNYENRVIKYFENNICRLVNDANRESDYGVAGDEISLSKYFLENIHIELDKQPKLGEVIKNSTSGNMVGLPKGICVGKLSAYLPVLMAMQSIILAIHTNNPIIIVPSNRSKKSVISMVEDLQEIAENSYYPENAISVLKHISKTGEKELFTSSQVSLVIENCLSEESRLNGSVKADWFQACLGNNIVFVEKTANLDKAANDIVMSKSFNNGLLPGVEQSVVVEKVVYVAFKIKLEDYGAYFLNEDEEKRLEETIYHENHKPRKELIGKSADEIAKIAGITIPVDTKILVVTKPYVSINSPYSKEKYHPILSLYIEDDWRHACEKCIELILNDEKGQSLSIYTNDSYVIEQFIEKKPVARVLTNVSTGFGSIGLTSDLPLSFSISTKQVGGVSCKSLTSNHFMFFREIGITNGIKNDVLVKNNINKECSKSLFSQMTTKDI